MSARVPESIPRRHFRPSVLLRLRQDVGNRPLLAFPQRNHLPLQCVGPPPAALPQSAGLSLHLLNMLADLPALLVCELKLLSRLRVGKRKQTLVTQLDTPESVALLGAESLLQMFAHA